MRMQDKFDPMQYEVMTYLWVVGLSAWGGIAGYVRKIKSGHCRFSLSELVGEMFISGFVGIITFLLCQAAMINPVLSAALVGISGHMGSRAIMLIEKVIQEQVEKKLSSNDKP